jgi:hypothetical protein
MADVDTVARAACVATTMWPTKSRQSPFLLKLKPSQHVYVTGKVVTQQRCWMDIGTSDLTPLDEHDATCQVSLEFSPLHY